MKITGENLNIENVWLVAYGQEKVELAPSCKKKMLESRRYIEQFLKKGKTVYGVNTGFGALSSVSISNDQIIELQKNLIRSHSVGVGEIFTIEETRAILLLRANALARGHSGVRVDVVEKLLEFLNKNVMPVVPGQGSVGASGDLAPLAHVALALMGEGEVIYKNKRMKTSNALKAARIEPILLQAKEGLSLINGCQVMTAVGLLNTYEARRLNWLTDLAGSMSLEAMRGARSAFDPLIAATRAHPGEAKTARNLLRIMGKNSKISLSHEDCGRVQDAYSLRCMPQVHGAAKDTLRYVSGILEVESNSSTDNPLVFADKKKVLSCGNFHGEPVAFALDFLGISVAATASISECRIEKLINPAMSGLPAFLAENSGLNSGMMIVQVAAASLVSENKILSHPASVDSIPTSADKEDHVSMGTIAARKLGKIVRNAENVCAMELLCAAQGLDFLKPLKPSAGVLSGYNAIRKVVPYASKDRTFHIDITAIRELIRSGKLLKAVTDVTGDLEW
ncbi:MAG: histidine ammonia-lyase [Oligoflexia bacterium]|nr:histidine ammonia-lyase [Oligoflexia bacterium]